jgi:hypothetical protein
MYYNAGVLTSNKLEISRHCDNHPAGILERRETTPTTATNASSKLIQASKQRRLQNSSQTAATWCILSHSLETSMFRLPSILQHNDTSCMCTTHILSKRHVQAARTFEIPSTDAAKLLRMDVEDF